MRPTLFATAIALSCVAPTNAQGVGYFRTGNDLLRDCSEPESSSTYYQAQAQCRGYIIGAYDDFMLARDTSGLPDCTSYNITVGQVADVIIKYLKDNPARRNLAGSLIVRLAIIDAWPYCAIPPTP